MSAACCTWRTDRLYPFWGNLTEALCTGQPQNEIKQGGGNPFEAIYADPQRLRLFLGAMTGISLGTRRRSRISSRGTIPEFHRHRLRAGRSALCRWRSPSRI
jgi:hypothetical protein